MCTVPLTPGVNPAAVDKYINNFKSRANVNYMYEDLARTAQ